MIQSAKTRFLYVWLTVFFISMGYIESAVVVYLRKIYYPDGFSFPLSMLDMDIAITEIIREAFTLLVLAALGILAGRSKLEKLGFFFYGFAIWDIFYYVFLKLLLDWPDSFLTWDILFLIPITWTGPVIAPVIISLIMILFSLSITLAIQKNHRVQISKRESILLIAGTTIVFISFIYDYLRFINPYYGLIEMFKSTNQAEIMKLTVNYIPVKFPWVLFILGSILIFGGIWMFYVRSQKNTN